MEERQVEISADQQHRQRQPRLGESDSEQPGAVPLGSYALAIALWWREILLFGMAAAVLGASGIFALDVLVPKYTASTDVAILGRKSQVAIDERFTAVNSDLGRRNRAARQAALVGLVHKPDLARQVFAQLEEQLDEDATPATLLGQVDAELVTLGMASNRPESDLIRISADASSPGLAKSIVDAWTEAFITDVNVLYEDVPARVLETVQAELSDVRRRYLEAENKLRAHTAASRVELLDQQIAAKNNVVAELLGVWQRVATSSFQKNVESQLDAAEETLARLQRLEADLFDAEALRQQLDSDGPSSVASNSLAIYLFKAKLLAGDPTLEINLGTVPKMSAADQRQDMDQTIKSVRQQIARAEEAVAIRNEELASLVGGQDEGQSNRLLLTEMIRQLDTTRDQPMMALLEQLEEEKRVLAVERREDATRGENLALERDLLRTALTTLQNEMVELELTIASSTTQVRLASLAILPAETAWPATPLVAAICLFAGLLGALLLAPIVSALGREPPIAAILARGQR